MPYLFVHFREKTTPDGEQVYFGLSQDGFRWETVNGGFPILWAYYGDKGVRDFTIVRCEDSGKFFIFATDLSLSYGMRNQYHHSWAEIGAHGSNYFSVWESDNLTDWSEQRLVSVGAAKFGCMWAPDILSDPRSGEYILHWSSPQPGHKEGWKAIYYSKTKDFQEFSEPELLYKKEDCGIIDSAMYEENGSYYLFVKSEHNPASIILLRSEEPTGPFERVEAFDQSMGVLENGLYEAPTAVRLDDGSWCLFLDFYGVPGAGQGYIPFHGKSLKEGVFVRSDQEFHFPYGFKHGTILKITEEEYARIRGHIWLEKDCR